MCSYCIFTASHGFTRLVRMHIKLTGPAVKSLVRLFAFAWSTDIRKPQTKEESRKRSKDATERVKHGRMFFQRASGFHWYINVNANENTDWMSAWFFNHQFLNCSAGRLEKKDSLIKL